MKKYLLDWGTLSPINHIRLVNRCYPNNPTEKSVPRANKLSTLVFYANAKPTKITKICKYMMEKIQLDVTLNHHGRNKISIDILSSLLENCHNFIHLFALDYLKMMRILLDGDGHALIISETTQAFIMYCQMNHDQISYINDDIMKALNRILSRLSHLCTKSPISDEKGTNAKQYEITCSGLRGLHALASMESFRGVGVARRIEDFWTAIFYNIVLEEPVKLPAGKLPAHASIIKPSLGDGEPNVFEPPAVNALDVLKILISQTTSTTIPMVLEPFFAQVLDESKEMTIIIKIVEKLIPDLQTRHLFLLLNQVLELAKARSSHARVIKFFLSVIGSFLCDKRLCNFPIVALVDPLLDILNVSECPEGTKTTIQNIIETISITSHLQSQLIHAVSACIRRTNLPYADVPCIRNALLCVKYLFSKLTPTTTLGFMEYEEYRLLLKLSGNQDFGIRCLALNSLALVLKQSGGLAFYASSQSHYIDLIYGGIFHHMKKFTTKLELWLFISCLNACFCNVESILFAIPHVLKLPSDVFIRTRASILSSFMKSSSAILSDTSLLSPSFVPKIEIESFDTSHGNFFKLNTAIDEIKDDGGLFLEDDVNEKIIELLSHDDRMSRIRPLLNRRISEYREYPGLPISTESSPTTTSMEATILSSDESNETRAEYPRNVATSKPLSLVMTESVTEFKKALEKTEDYNFKSSSNDEKKKPENGKASNFSFEMISKRNAIGKKKFLAFLEGI